MHLETRRSSIPYQQAIACQAVPSYQYMQMVSAANGSQQNNVSHSYGLETIDSNEWKQLHQKQ